jgi:hypothetical protein
LHHRALSSRPAFGLVVGRIGIINIGIGIGVIFCRANMQRARQQAVIRLRRCMAQARRRPGAQPCVIHCCSGRGFRIDSAGAGGDDLPIDGCLRILQLFSDGKRLAVIVQRLLRLAQCIEGPSHVLAGVCRIGMLIAEHFHAKVQIHLKVRQCFQMSPQLLEQQSYMRHSGRRAVVHALSACKKLIGQHSRDEGGMKASSSRMLLIRRLGARHVIVVELLAWHAVLLLLRRGLQLLVGFAAVF